MNLFQNSKQQHNHKIMAIYIIIAIFFVILDRFLKFFALKLLIEPIYIVGDIFKLSLAKNYYIAFSIPLAGPILNFIILAIIIILGYLMLILVKKKEYLLVGYLTNILFGAISNIYDRLQYGFVIDYFDLKYYSVFNIADSMIVVGSIFLAISLYKKNV